MNEPLEVRTPTGTVTYADVAEFVVTESGELELHAAGRAVIATYGPGQWRSAIRPWQRSPCACRPSASAGDVQTENEES